MLARAAKKASRKTKATKKKAASKKAAAEHRTCRTVVKKRGRKTVRTKVCAPAKPVVPASRRSAPKVVTGTGANVTGAAVGTIAPAATAPAPASTRSSAAAPATAAPPAPPATSAPPVTVALPPPLTADEAKVERLLWRAGFGPAPGQRAALAGQDYGTLVRSLTRPAGPATLTGPAPVDDNGAPLQPATLSGHDHCAWLDRMVRTDQPLVERIALVWHDWFATSFEGAGAQHQLMLDQIELFRSKGLGCFDDLLAGVTQDPAMLLWLNTVSSTKYNVNENYARELMELFTLGADRGAYTETDVREVARSLTGFAATFTSGTGWGAFRYDPTRHDATAKTVFGQTGNWSWPDVVRMVVEHPLHASFFCGKLWSYFVPTAPSADTLAALQAIYTGSGRQIAPVVEAILQHADFLTGEDMMVPPVVYNAGLLRATGLGIDTILWTWYALLHGQRLYYPPDVCGWDDDHWLNTTTVRGRWAVASLVVYKRAINPYTSNYATQETPEAAVAAALAFLGDPSISPAALAVATDYAKTTASTATSARQRGVDNAVRQNALRLLIATSPDLNVC